MVTRRLPRVRVISLGGTWNMVYQEAKDGHRHKVPGEIGTDFDLEAVFPGVGEFCAPSVEELARIDSTNMAPDTWQRTAEYIARHRDSCEGFVVIQGTDTLAFSAAGLAFALQGLGKPVVVTGAQIERTTPGSDATNNVLNACKLAALADPDASGHTPALPEVAVLFGNRIIRATRCRKYSECDLDAFDTVNVPLLGKVQVKPWRRRSGNPVRFENLKLDQRLVIGKPGAAAFAAASRFDPEVSLLYIHPGMRAEVVDAVGDRSKGLVLAAYGAGNVPSLGDDPCSLTPAIARLVRRGIPVVVTTQCVLGQAEPGAYEAGTAALSAGAIIANDMTPETAFVKLSWLLANKERWPRRALDALERDPAQNMWSGPMGACRIAMLTNLAGEIMSDDERSSLYGSV